tara:strand:+ start:953 stop:5107 length:4155 start_codon:yes stop_codon:yes gene_type:complete
MDGVKSINFNNDALKGDKHKIDDFLNNADAIVGSTGGYTGGAGNVDNVDNEANDISESTFATDDVDIDADIDIDIDDIDIINTEPSVQDIEDKVESIVDKPIVDKQIVDKQIVDKQIVDKPIVDKPIVDEKLKEIIGEEKDSDEEISNDTDEEEFGDETVPFDFIEKRKAHPLDVWALIDTYFRDNPYYKSKHQLDSYNELIYSKTNGIEYIIKRENPLIIYKEPFSNGFKYEIYIYFGETFNKSDDKESDRDFVNMENIFLSTPTIYDDTVNMMKYMYPNDARLKSLNYGMNIFCNMAIKIIDNEKNKTEYQNFEKVNIGSIPIMVHSKPCLLNGLENQKLTELGECPYDPGGYFIIKGNEKVILSQEKKVDNILYINDSPEDSIILQCLLKSISTEGFQSSRTNAISYIRTNIAKEMEKPAYKNHIVVRILGIGIGDNSKFKIPLFILFRALGIQNDKDILNMIIYENDSDNLKNKLLDELLNTIKDSEPIYTQKNAYKFLSLQTKGKDNINVIDILNNNFLPNYKNDNLAKSKFLAYSVRKLLLTHLGIIKKTDRDNYSYKRIDTPGTLLLDLYRELWSKYQRNISLKIDTEYKFNFEKVNKDIFNIINLQNKNMIFDVSIMNSINKSFGGTFGTSISARQGIVQELNRLSMLGTLSHIRRLVNPLPAGSKSIGPRRLHNSQWGFVCPTESPDGGNVGVYNHLSIISTISFNISIDGIYNALLEHNLLTLNEIVYKDIYLYCKVFINGKWMGLHRDPEFLCRLFKLLKLNSIINIYTSISWNKNMNEMYIFTDSGRIVRPILRLKYGKDGNKVNDLIDGNLELMKNWKSCVHGYMYKLNTNISVYDEIYHKDVLDDIKRDHGTEYLTFLENNAAPLEYIDSMESEYAFIARDIYSIDHDYTHCEIHSSLILSPLALQIPFPEHSQYPRNVFSCQQTKQAVGVYSSAYNTRFDTAGNILNYPQKPIVTTRYNKYTDVDKLPNGMNIVVAIASYTGFNQEDSIIVNRSSVERGMFNTMSFKSYEDDETINMSGDVDRFFNPTDLKNVFKKDTDNYDKLDDNGFVREGEYVNFDDIIVSKTMTKTLVDGTEINSISGKKVKFMTSGKVDRVVVTKNRDNLRKCKIRIFKEKIPDVGDKYASRCGQKGMCGMLLEQHQMPFTKEGIVPDLMINPHAIPSRMTINQLLEVVLGKSSVISGRYGDATPFQNNNIDSYTNILEKCNFEKHGNEVMYSGITGEQLHTSIFIGPTYYQRLKIMVSDKMFSRGTGPLEMLTRQPAGGRGNQGGLRIGEMERDSILGHGVMGFLNESMMERADKYNVQIDKYTGLISYDDNPITDKNIIQIPYTAKLLIQELQTMSVASKIVTPTNISNPILFEHMNDIYSS